MRNIELQNMESKTCTNIRACKCYQDGAYIARGDGIGIWIPSRGQRYLCRQCAQGVQAVSNSYHTSARRGFAKILGTQKKGLLQSTTIGIEIEGIQVADVSDYALRLYLQKLGTVESDASVDYEVPTAPMQGLKTLSKFLEYVERGGFLPCVNNEQCGAHIHVQCNNIDYVRRYYHSIFLPLAKWIENLGSEKRIEIFGSDFRHYAQMIDRDTWPQNHTNIFNCQHEQTLEFRLPRIAGKDQYMQVVKFWREVGYTVNTWKFHKEDPSNDVRLANAKLCSERLVWLANKYFN